MDWGIVYYADPTGEVPASMFLDACPTKVAATFIAVLDAVREAPPPAFSGGGNGEAMHGTMAGYHEAEAARGVVRCLGGRPRIVPKVQAT